MPRTPLHDLCAYVHELSPEQISECVRRYLVEYVNSTKARIRDRDTGGIVCSVESTDYRAQQAALERELVGLAKKGA